MSRMALILRMGRPSVYWLSGVTCFLGLLLFMTCKILLHTEGENFALTLTGKNI